MRVTKVFHNFFESEKSGGIILIIATIVSLVMANSALQSHYEAFWLREYFDMSITSWINDGLMAIFFLLIGLELEREIYDGELSDMKRASLPIFGALGGMLVPAGIYLAINFGTSAQNGAGIPMATDIAFAVGILSLLGNRVPASLKVFLTALAVIDDLGAILVIAIFYTKSISFVDLGISLGIFALLGVLNLVFKVRNIIPYTVGGVAMWWFMHHSGIHATITGVLLAFALPFGNGDEKSTSYLVQNFLHAPVAFFILPLFALANTAIVLGDHWQSGLTSLAGIGIILGLFVGKPLGIGLFSYLAVKLKFCRFPQGIKAKHIFGVGILGGIGFTMSIFITLLAYDDEQLINTSKMAILIASLLSGVSGLVVLKFLLRKKYKPKIIS
ncbi:MAG: Na+/H+ antiporter NhaA [Flavobacterium sp.]|uniref:Na+/H+ antiporter NhaA n=1 Tax=Flavobacterium sp. TaxID=239 RepID=UPI0012202923|nr:Na+/H+ antiporter NhaA [Flavobacterium sp.]RZJ65447.1 MAG: Na+/H+ antiporter NhaA [Flavobacterium sp.]